MSTTAQGKRAEDKARRILEADGCKVHQAVPEVRVQWDPSENEHVRKPQQDLWELFDLAAICLDGLRLVQVCHPSDMGPRKRKILDAWDWDRYDNALEGIPWELPMWLWVQVWVFQGAGFHVYDLKKGRAWEEDKDWHWEKVNPVAVVDGDEIA